MKITMPLFTIDTLQFSQRMQKAGLQKKAADELAEVIKETQTQSFNQVASTHDVMALKKDITSLEKEIKNLEIRLDQKIESLEHKLTTKMFLMLTAAVGAITWLDKIII
jgi:hypothetical protein